MATNDDFGRWCPVPTMLRDVDGVRARDLLADCFYHAQHQTFTRMKQKMGTTWDEESVRKSVNGAIRTTLAQVGGSWDSPTRDDLLAAAQVLARRARSWGTPDDIIVAHQAEYGRVLERLND
ncbi:MAG TPA: hypothetical protein DCP20_10980 [Coriobacteriia bacterium]|jgi:hypothetical protein|nr:hypothetical protein [Coriobacteriia bacterium]